MVRIPGVPGVRGPAGKAINIGTNGSKAINIGTGNTTGAVPISIGTTILPPTKYFDIVLTPPKGCAVRIESNGGDEIITIHENKTISILGETFSLELIKNYLSKFNSDVCKCSVIQLMNKGCDCGGT